MRNGRPGGGKKGGEGRKNTGEKKSEEEVVRSANLVPGRLTKYCLHFRPDPSSVPASC